MNKIGLQSSSDHEEKCQNNIWNAMDTGQEFKRMTDRSTSAWSIRMTNDFSIQYADKKTPAYMLTGHESEGKSSMKANSGLTL